MGALKRVQINSFVHQQPRGGGNPRVSNNSEITRHKINELTRRFKCSMKTCKLTSSVKIACPVPAPGVEPYIVADMCVVEGLSLDSKKRA